MLLLQKNFFFFCYFFVVGHYLSKQQQRVEINKRKAKTIPTCSNTEVFQQQVLRCQPTFNIQVVKAKTKQSSKYYNHKIINAIIINNKLSELLQLQKRKKKTKKQEELNNKTNDKKNINKLKQLRQQVTQT